MGQINDAIQNATNGSTVWLPAGEFDEDYILVEGSETHGKNLKIVGHFYGTTVHLHNPQGLSFLNCETITLKDFIITNESGVVIFFNNTIAVCSNLDISVEAHEYDINGIVLTIGNNNISNCIFSDFSRKKDNAIYLTSLEENYIYESIITDCIFGDFTGIRANNDYRYNVRCERCNHLIMDFDSDRNTGIRHSIFCYDCTIRYLKVAHTKMRIENSTIEVENWPDDDFIIIGHYGHIEILIVYCKFINAPTIRYYDQDDCLIQLFCNEGDINTTKPPVWIHECSCKTLGKVSCTCPICNPQ